MIHYLKKPHIFLNRMADLLKYRFRDKAINPPQELTEFLKRLNAHSIPHSQISLLKHLVGTYRLLKVWGVPEYVCVAGLYHSIYGTQTFNISLIKPTQRESVKTIISPQSEKLVYYFYIQDKKHFFFNLNQIENFALKDRINYVEISLTKEEFTDMLIIRLADYIEQMDRLKFDADFLKDILQQSKSFLSLQEYNAILNSLPNTVSM